MTHDYWSGDHCRACSEEPPTDWLAVAGYAGYLVVMLGFLALVFTMVAR